ncbi:MAG: hypothetical protein ACUZ8O_09895 [Candidatus Anammoxibacter sp.]
MEKLLNSSDVCQRLNIPNYKLDYLFKSRKLKKENFNTLGNRQLVFNEGDLDKIKEALFGINSK